MTSYRKAKCDQGTKRLPLATSRKTCRNVGSSSLLWLELLQR